MRLTTIMKAYPRSAALLCALIALSSRAWGLSAEDARHLLIRTGYDASPAQVQRIESMTRNQAVQSIVDRASRDVRRLSAAPPTWARMSHDIVPRPLVRGLPPAQAELNRVAYQKELSSRGLQLKEWEVEELVRSPDPFAEKMVLFWHNNFTSSLDTVRDPGLMFNQDQTLRRYAFGSFAQMLHAMARDPAMIVYLDNETNTKGKPNENFAREVMELFTLGVGNYTEQDIKQSARAFTGWRVDYATGRFRYEPRLHDDGVKTFMGRSGNWNGDDILSIILDQKQVSLYITTKLWKELVSPTPDQAEVERLAARFKASGYQIGPLLIGLLETPEFWAPQDRGELVKSPVELLVGAVRTLGIEAVPPRQIVWELRNLGQDLFNPPTVKGWPTGTGWIDSDTLILRRSIMSQFVSYYARERRGASSPQKGQPAPLAALTPAHLLSRPPIAPCTARPGTLACLRGTLIDPAYELE